MATYEFKLPELGEGVMEGEIVKWLVKPGDAVKEDQAVVEIMTDKATVSVPSPRKGRIVRTIGKEGEIAKVHGALLEMEIDGSAPAAVSAHGAPAAAPIAAQAPVAQAPTAPVPSNEHVLATPVTRRMAKEHGVDLSKVSGSGPQGRVLKSDVEAFLSARPTASAASGRPAQVFAPLTSGGSDQRIAIKGLRKKIADKMVRSKFTAPHYAFVEEVDMSALVSLRTRLNAQLQASGDPTKLSFLPFFCKALVAAFKKFPDVNANMDEAAQELIVRGDFNFGIAAMTEQGLTVPVVKHVDRLSVRALGAEIARLATAARDQKLKLEELTGGTFTITSLGADGGLFATPIINHPEVAIMGVHRMRKRPVVDEHDQIVVKPIALFSFCFDHRVIDGARGAQFAYEFIRHVEKPELLFLDLV
jgi:pyruvate dehydrogenase E2 component (dihydrolipoamide acetyltransferase)